MDLDFGEILRYPQHPGAITSIASILTSKYPGNHSIGFDPEGKLDAQVDRTLASILKENNYRTAAFSGGAGYPVLIPVLMCSMMGGEEEIARRLMKR